LRAELELPGSDEVAVSNDPNLPEKYRKAVAGRAVSLSARIYDVDASSIFSATVDAMTALNLPVDSVDSPSGIVTSDWIRKGANNSNMFGGIFGAVNGPKLTKHRFVVRVFRLKTDGLPKSKLEIRVLGQVYDNGHWVNKPFKQDVSKELFDAVEEQLARIQSAMPPSAPIKAEPGNVNNEESKVDTHKGAAKKEAVIAAVEGWRQAWSAKDTNAYFSAYASDFSPESGFASRAAWRKYKQRVIEKKTFINVQLEDIKVEKLSDGMMGVSFLQHFVSNNYTSDDRKQLTLSKQPEGWKIIRETTL